MATHLNVEEHSLQQHAGIAVAQLADLAAGPLYVVLGDSLQHKTTQVEEVRMSITTATIDKEKTASCGREKTRFSG